MMEIDENNNNFKKLNIDLVRSFPISIELRKRKEKTLLQFSQEELEKNQDKILTLLKKECVDLKTWFLLIVSLNYHLYYQ